jgi:hypothetical protein
MHSSRRQHGRGLIAYLIAGFLLSLPALGATKRVSGDGLWQDVTEETILSRAGGERLLFPRGYRTVALNVSSFQHLAAKAPMEFTPEAKLASPTISIPMPDGTFADFRMQESPIMTPELAAKLPDVKTYSIQGVDDRAAVGRVDFTPFGFHAYIFSPAGAVLIDPFRRGDATNYISYWRRDYTRPSGAPPFHCEVIDEKTSTATPVVIAEEEGALPKTRVPLTASGATLRTYRLALAGTGEYTAFYGGTVIGAQAGMVTTMNRVDLVYEQEVAVRLVMVDNTSIVYTNAGTDPYANTSGDLNANQSTIDSKIGAANYDIGHLFGTGGGGVAQLGVPCRAGMKAKGLTGSSSPVGDGYDIDYVAHEMGHQFGGNHTFNGTTSNCGGGNRAASAAYEPGSGTTIMAYAGICGAEDLQPHSDAYFHVKSYEEIVAYTTTGLGNGCAVQTATGNSAPTSVSAGSAITIPKSTPFYLTGSATDPEGDALTYCWEEYDLGSSAPPNTDVTAARPIFRSFNPVLSTVRTFPKLSDLLDNVSTIGESLPTRTRTMTFRMTARDNKAGGGGVNWAATTVAVTSTAGPFLVTAPNTDVVWTSGATHTVAWNVANTTAAPVNCANVKILLSTDGGNTFPTTLAASTPNDGSETVTAPVTPSLTGRVRVECATAPFFDISNVNFSIADSINVAAAATTSTSVDVNWTGVPLAVSYDIYRRGAGGAFTKIGSSVTTNYTDNTALANTAYLYAVKSIDAGAVASVMSPPDLATTFLFTDPLLTEETTVIQAAHFTELRTAVNAVRTLAGLSAATFTDPVLTAGTTMAKLVHLSELRSALDAARVTLGLIPVTYADAVPVAQTTVVKAAHLNELRSGLQ